jgi:hypothetical protein
VGGRIDSRQTDKHGQSDRQVGRETDRQGNSKIDLLIDRHAGKEILRHTERQTGMATDRKVG